MINNPPHNALRRAVNRAIAEGSPVIVEQRPAAKRNGLNDTERAQWIDNHEGLYNWWKASKLSKRVFIRLNRASIDATIDAALNPSRLPDWNKDYTRRAVDLIKKL